MRDGWKIISLPSKASLNSALTENYNKFFIDIRFMCTIEESTVILLDMKVSKDSEVLSLG